MPSRLTEHLRRATRWLLPAAALALAPKCLLCVLAYAGLGGALGLGGPELCGPPASQAPSLAWLGVAGGIGMFGFLAGCRRGRSAPEENRTGADSAATRSALTVDRDADFRQRDIS